VYEQEYEIQIRRGGKLDGYRQFRTLSGHLARFAVAVEVAEAEDLVDLAVFFSSRPAAM
jgi:hypothetical protein